MKIFIWIKKLLYPFLLCVVTVYISIVNFTPGTFLTGWDTLHPEFNFKMYWGRMLMSVWQAHQGLGAVASQAHAAEIPRILILQFLSIFLSLNALRYSYAFLMLIIGPLGVYFFLERVFLKSFSEHTRRLAAFVGGLFYVLNLGTLQHFYVPLEMFLTHYGFLGWVLLFASTFYESGLKKHYYAFLLFSFFMIPQSHTPTLFYAFFLILGIYLIGLIVGARFLNKETDRSTTLLSLKRTVVLMLATFLLNSFWLLPNLYFVANHSKEISESKIHHLFSEEAFLQNQEFGQLKDFAILRNFLFNWGEDVGNDQFGDLLGVWKLHLENPKVLYLGYFYFVLVLLGIVLSMVKKNRVALSLLVITLISLFFILNDNPPFGVIFEFLQSHYPVFKEALRFPFTKFSMFLMFSYASFLAYVIAFLINLFSKFKFKYLVVFPVIFSLGIIVSLFWYAKPMFYGYLISPTMRMNIPQRYFDMFSYLQQQKDYGRVADLPINTFWGWIYYNWIPQTKLGYQGAGFLWFGIKQPLLDREFDRWDILNEQYYREMSTSIYSQDVAGLERTLEKYKISWILLDKSVISPGADPISLFYPQTEALIAQSKKITLARDFGGGLELYKYAPDTKFEREKVLNSFVYSNDSVFKEYNDPVYAEFGDYAQTGSANYPYLGITKYTENLSEQVISSDDKNVYFSNKISAIPLTIGKTMDIQYKVTFVKDSTGKIMLELVPTQPELVATLKQDMSLPIQSVDGDKFAVVLNDSTPILINTNSQPLTAADNFVALKPGESLKIDIYKMNALPINNSINLSSLLERCSDSEGGSSYSVEYTSTGFTLTAKDIVSCLTLDLSPYLEGLTGESSVFSVQANVSTNSALGGICIFDEKTGLCENKPLLNGQTASLLTDIQNHRYLLRFLTYNLNNSATEGSVSINDVVFSTGTKLASATLVTSPDTQEIPVQKLVFQKDPALSGNILDLPSDPRICSNGSRDFGLSKVFEVDKSFTRYESHKDSLCDSYHFPFARHDTGYILEIKARNISGIPLRICLTNEYSKRCDIYVSLETNKDFTTAFYMIPPMGQGSGYTFNLNNLVFGDGTSINDLEYISLTPFPYDFLRTLHQQVQHASTEKMYVLNEAFENGWTAFCGFKLCDAKHVMVDNWSNGWVFKDGVIPSNIKTIFIPQFLQYLGLLVFPLIFILLS